jgi:flagellar basal-body rod protein FlgB
MADIFGTINRLHKAMDFTVQRHGVIASNLANAETPGFRPFELTHEAPEETPFNLTLDATGAGHIGPEAGELEINLRQIQTGEPGANGNAVNLDHEMSKLAANDLRFEGATKIVSSQLAMLRYAANDGSGG